MILKKEKDRCSICDSPYVVNKTHMLCNKHNQERLDKQRTDKKKKKKSIPTFSKKRLEENKEYVEIRERKRSFQKEKGFYKCFFSNTYLNDEEMEVDCHHVTGRDGDGLAEWGNLFFAIRRYHRAYHDMSLDQLMNTTWYLPFVERLKTFHREGYNQELRRMNKAGVIDDTQFMKMYKPEK